MMEQFQVEVFRGRRSLILWTRTAWGWSKDLVRKLP